MYLVEGEEEGGGTAAGIVGGSMGASSLIVLWGQTLQLDNS